MISTVEYEVTHEKGFNQAELLDGSVENRLAQTHER
jgi:hypothetical protein